MRMVKTRYLDEEQERTVFTSRSVFEEKDGIKERKIDA